MGIILLFVVAYITLGSSAMKTLHLHVDLLPATLPIVETNIVNKHLINIWRGQTILFLEEEEERGERCLQLFVFHSKFL